MNYLKVSLLFGALLCLNISTFAQRPGPRGERGGPQGPNLEMLQKALDLSEAQVAALEPIMEDTKAAMQALRNQEFDSPEARKTAAKAIMDTQKEKVNAVLNADQIKKMDKIQQERQERGPRGPGTSGERGEQGKALHTALENYHETNIEPVMQAQRAKLEAKLSAEDKTTIAEFRAKKATHQAERKANKTKGQRPEPTEAQKAERKADHETIKALVTKYDAEIESLLEEIAPQSEKWKADTKAIREEYLPKKAEDDQQTREMRGKMKGSKGKEGKSKDGAGRAKAFHKTQFLLLDPSAPASSRSLEESPFQLEAYPNPAGSSTTINYTVKKDGQINIVLRNKAGNLNRVLLSSFQKAGTYTLDINTSDLQGGNYFYTINDGSGSKPVTKQLLITK